MNRINAYHTCGGSVKYIYIETVLLMDAEQNQMLKEKLNKNILILLRQTAEL